MCEHQAHTIRLTHPAELQTVSSAWVWKLPLVIMARSTTIWVLDSIEKIRLRKEKVPYEQKSLWSIVVCLVHQSPKFQGTFSCCLRDLKLQFLHRDGPAWEDDETTSLGLHCRRSCNGEDCHFFFQQGCHFSFLEIHMTAMFHSGYTWQISLLLPWLSFMLRVMTQNMEGRNCMIFSFACRWWRGGT